MRFKVGDKACYTRMVTSDLIAELADVSEDYNPLHIDAEYASKTVFGAKIAHGLFCIGLISRVIGMQLPGEGSVFVNEKLNYRKPVYVGDSITAHVEIISINEKRLFVEVQIRCVNQKDEVVMDGTSLLKIMKRD